MSSLASSINKEKLSPKKTKAKPRSLNSRERRALKEQVLALLPTLAPLPAGLFRKGTRKQFQQGSMRYRLVYTSAGRFVVARLLLNGRDITQYWYSTQGYVLTVTLPGKSLSAKGARLPEQPTVSEPYRTLPSILTHIPFRNGDIRILDDETLAARGIRSDLEILTKPNLDFNCWRTNSAQKFVHRLFNDNKFETLRKVGAPIKDLCGYNLDTVIENWYRQAVMMYNHGKHYDLYTWLDFMRMLSDAGKDTNNPSVYLPDNLDYAHQKMVNTRQRQRDRLYRKQRLAADRQTFLDLPQEEKEQYARKIERFKKIILSDGIFRITTLATIDQHYEDAVTLHHCLFHNKYYEKDNTIVVRVTKENTPEKPYADAEIEFRKGEILQIYGNQNLLLPEKEHEAVKTLIKENIRRYINAGKRSPSVRPLLAVETFQPAFVQN